MAIVDLCELQGSMDPQQLAFQQQQQQQQLGYAQQHL
jgi:hypothetical protein